MIIELCQRTYIGSPVVLSIIELNEESRIKMKRKIIIILTYCLMTLSACQSYVNEDETYSTVKDDTKADDITSKYASLQEIRESKEKVMEQAFNGKWNNLHIEQFEPYVPDEDEVYNISWENKNYKGLTGIDIFKEQLKIIEYYANDYPNGEFIMEDEIEGFRTDWKYEKIQRILDSDKVQFPKGLDTVSYEDQREKEYYLRNSVTTNPTFSLIRVNHRKITNTALEPMIESGTYVGEGVPGMNEWFLETIKVYLSNSTDGSLNDEWQMLDGKMSVKDCVNLVENYFETQVPFDKNPDIEAKVYLIRVYKVTDEVYAYSCMVGRKIYGLTTEVYPSSFGGAVEGIVTDGGLAEVIEHDKLDVIDYVPLSSSIEKEGKAITEIISLEYAFNLLSNRIGENSTYKILSAELGYSLTERYGEDNLYTYGKGTPIWRIMTMNENDNKNYVFEIDCVTGDIRSRQKKLY